MGRLRDSRFVELALASKDPAERIIAISCLAFLDHIGAGQRLRELAESDPELGARESAKWAVGVRAP